MTSLSSRNETACFGSGMTIRADLNQALRNSGAASGSARMARRISSSVCASIRRQSDVLVTRLPMERLVVRFPFIACRLSCADDPAGFPSPRVHHGDDPRLKFTERDHADLLI